VTFPIVLKTDRGNLIRMEVTGNLIDSEEAIFLCGEKTLKGWNMMLDFGKQKLTFKGHDGQKVRLERESHLLAKLEMVGELEDVEAVHLVRTTPEATSLTQIRKIHQNLNHKSKVQMESAYKNAGKLDREVRMLI